MKFLIVSLILFSQICLSQTNLDKVCLSKINSYRKSYSKPEFVWNDIAFKSANHHSNYLKDSCDMTISHHESILVNPQDRLKYFGSGYTEISENVLLASLNFYESESEENINIKISEEVLDLWKNSQKHNKIMLSDCKLGGISTVIQEQETGIGGYKNYLIWATLIVYNP